MGRYSNGEAAGGSYPLVAVCIDKDKNSHNALKYATETLVHKGQTIILVHVHTRGTSGGAEDVAGYKQPSDPQMQHLFLPFRCFCTRKDIHYKDVVLDDHDVAKSIVEFATHGAVKKIVVGACTRNSFVRFRADIPTSVCKMAPDFSTVYVVTKGGKVTSMRQAVRQVPAISPLRTMIQVPNKPSDHVAAQKWTPPLRPYATRGDPARLEGASGEVATAKAEAAEAKRLHAEVAAELAGTLAEAERLRERSGELCSLLHSGNTLLLSALRRQVEEMQDLGFESGDFNSPLEHTPRHFTMAFDCIADHMVSSARFTEQLNANGLSACAGAVEGIGWDMRSPREPAMEGIGCATELEATEVRRLVCPASQEVARVIAPVKEEDGPADEALEEDSPRVAGEGEPGA